MRRRAKRWLILPDAHFPYHDVGAMRCVLKAADEYRPDHVLILGDWMDNEKFTNHPKSTVKELESHTYQEVVDSIRYYLDELQKYGAHLTYLEGNHEHWVERWCVRNAGLAAPDVYEVMAPETVLGAGRENFEWVDYIQRDITKYELAPNLWACHGWYHSEHAAAAHMKRLPGLSLVHGHTHRAEMKKTRDPRTDEPIIVWSPGSLCQPQPMYKHGAPTAWTLGFTVLFQSRTDPCDWTPVDVTIHPDGKGGRYCVLPNGKRVRAKA